MSRNYGYGRNNNRADTGLSMYLNPFTSKNATPKIPDGKSLLSTGLREQLTYQLDAPESDTKLNVFMLTPSFFKGFLIKRNLDPVATPKIVINNENDPFNGSGTTANGSLTTLKGEKTNAFNTEFATWTPDFATKLERIRLVSAGVKLMCTSNSGSNDGWFRAIRFVMNTKGTDEVQTRSFGTLLPRRSFGILILKWLATNPPEHRRTKETQKRNSLVNVSVIDVVLDVRLKKANKKKMLPLHLRLYKMYQRVGTIF